MCPTMKVRDVRDVCKIRPRNNDGLRAVTEYSL